MSEYLFKKKNLSNYSVVNEPGTYILKVANVSPLYEDDGYPRYIVNFRAGLPQGFQDCLEIMGNREIVDYVNIRHCFLTGSIWQNKVDDVQDLPIKGEDVIASFDYVDDILQCQCVTLIPRKKPNKFDLNSMCTSRMLLQDLLLTNNDEL